MKPRITDIAKVVRSKNAGPFELTLDIIFKSRECFVQFRDRNVLTAKKISTLYKIPENDVAGIVYFEAANAVKITIRRRIPSGSPGDTDIYGAQQHAPLLEMQW
ncbi:MAG: DUF4387 domain-containing protein [Proteobacteria bacterium]|nr:DUF4387 domain-containing protein [Pseudomonadota bacterium]